MRWGLKSAFLLILGVSGGLLADQMQVSSFKGLNSNESSVIIDPDFAQDTLNVDVTPGGKSIKKRSGYGLYKTLSTTQGLHGGIHFFDSTGNDIQLWASSTSIYGIVADATPTQIVSSTTLNATMDCADVQGSAYCVTSGRDFYIKTNGATLQSWSTSPLGTMIEATPDRVVVAGVSGSASTLFVSGSNSFNTYTVGPLTTDPFNEVIAAPGSKLTHIRWGCQKLLWWKDQSFGYFDFDDQYSADLRIVSDTIGTFDNTSAIDPGGNVWFRGQDGHIYEYDCSGLVKQTIEITPQVQASGRRTSNSFTQTSQSDWQSGASSPTVSLSFTLSPGDVVPSSFSSVETAKADFQQGTSSSNITFQSGDMIISTNAVEISNNGFESGDYTNWTNSGFNSVSASVVGTDCTATPQAGSFLAPVSDNGFHSSNLIAELDDASSGNYIASSSITWVANSCSWVLRTITVGSAYARRKVKLKFFSPAYTLTSDPFILNGADVKFYTASGCAGAVCAASFFAIDTINNTPKSNITTANYTSKVYDTGQSTCTALVQANWTANEFVPYIELQTAIDSAGPWTQIATSSDTNANARRYIRYLSSFTVGTNDDALTTLNDATLYALSSGTYFSAWKNAPNFTSWGTFNPTTQSNGATHAFYVRASTSPQSVLNSTVAWVAQPENSLVATSTVGVYFQIIDSFTVTSASVPIALNAFTVNWFEGNATDQAYMTYFDNSIWTSVAFGVGISSNNYIFKRDLINDGWNLYYFGAGGMLIQNNHLFFGDVGSTGKIYQFGSGTSDNGSVINAFWKSKDFTGSDPFLQNQLTQIDTFARQNSNQSITGTYTLDTSTTSTSYTINLSTTVASIIQNRKLLPSGKNGYTFNYKLGDNSTMSNWEILGYRIGYTQLPYRPSQ